MNTDPEVDAYIERSPEEQRPLLRVVRTMIREQLPAATETLQSRMPVYTVGGQWRAGFASRKKGIMFYLMVGAVLDRHAGELGTLRTGKSCVELKATKTRPLDEVLLLCARMLDEVAKG